MSVLKYWSQTSSSPFTYTGTVVEGHVSSVTLVVEGHVSSVTPYYVANGFYQLLGIGSLSPSSPTIYGIYDYFVTGSSSAILKVTSPTDPGSTSITSVTVNGVTKSTSTASYSYSGGISTWSWGTLFGLSGSGSVSVSVVGATVPNQWRVGNTKIWDGSVWRNSYNIMVWDGIEWTSPPFINLNGVVYTSNVSFTTPGSGLITVPSSVNYATILAWGPGAHGLPGYNSRVAGPAQAGGGGGGALVVSKIHVTPGGTLNYTVGPSVSGPSTNTSISSGSISITPIQAGYGLLDTGGVATGGNLYNYNGNDGALAGGTGAGGLASHDPIVGLSYGYGGDGGYGLGDPGTAGGDGAVVVLYSLT